MSLRNLRIWHRRIALLLGLFLVFQGITGAISQYRFWLLGQFQPGYEASAAGREATPGEVIAIVERELSGFETAHVMYPAREAKATTVMAMGGYDGDSRMSRMVTVDQYEGEVVADMALRESAGWIGLANTLHKWTIFGTSGRIILTVVGLGGVLVSLFGLILYWRTRKAKPSSILARWHRSAGIVVGVVLLIVATSGTTLNLVTWYEEEAGTKVTAFNMREGMARTNPPDPVVDVDQAYQIARERFPEHRLAAFSPAGGHARHHWFAMNSWQMKRTDVLVDPDTGKIAGIKPAGLMEGGEGARHWLFPVHSLYLAGQVGGFISAMVGLSLTFWLFTGIVMWWRGRRVRKRASTG